MMKTTTTTKTRYLYLLATILSFSSFSQTTGYSGTGGNINVTYYRCEWTIDPNAASKTISGRVTMKFKTTQASVSGISIDLNNTSFNNGSLSVTYHGIGCTTSFSGNKLNITLPSTITVIHTLDSVVINYAGIPPGVSGAAEGYQRTTDPATGSKNYVMTLSESYEDRDWWPCKADMQDKADSMDFIVTVPWNIATNDTFWVATNGKLVSSPISGNWRTYTFQTRYPIASYLVCVSVARFKRFYNTVTINGTVVPVEYDLLVGKTAGTYTNIVNAMDKMNQVIVAFSNKFGDYPFKNEKHGYYDGLLGAGGMEHQTFSAIESSALQDLSTLAHELMHQWFGDKVSFATWNDLWLAEGFARYSEALTPELLPSIGAGNAVTNRTNYKTSANNASNRTYGTWIPNSSIGNSDLIWNSNYGSTVYDRGAMVVSMLRTLLGDTKFFQACQNYLGDPLLAYKSATTTDLQNHMQNVVGGYDLAPFFNSYVYGNGYPTYNLNWSKSATNRITIRLNSQTKSSGSTVSYYYTPIALRVKGSLSTQDTVIVIYDQNGNLSQAGNGISAPVPGNIISFNLNFDPNPATTTVTFDPFSQTLANGSITSVITLPVKITDFTLQENENSNRLRLSLYDDNNELQKIVLQKSDDGITFNDAGMMTKESTSGSLLSFVYTDYFPNNDITYYRTKLIEITGERFTKILKANNRKTTHKSVFPNPADKQVLVKWANKLPGKPYQVSIKGADGQLMLEKTTSNNSITIQTEILPAGIYFIQVKQENNSILNEKLVIRR